MTMSFSRSILQTALLLVAMILLYAQTSFAEASDIRALNALPAEGSDFYPTDTITFLGTVQNMVNEVVPEVGYADLYIDYNSDGLELTPLNANPDNTENMLGQLSSNGTKQLQEVVSNIPIGTHRYQFFVDTTDELSETDEDNNRSSWVTFSVVPVPVAPTITFSGATPMVLGGSATLTWTVTDATSCTGSNGWSGDKDADGDSQTVSPAVTTLYTLTCTGPGGTASKGFTVDVISPAPTVTLTPSANPVDSGTLVTLTWNTTNADTCTASGGWSGAKTTGSNQTGSVSPVTTTAYTLSCVGSGGTTTVSQTVTVNQPLPVITISASPASVTSGGTTTITWSVTNATYCRGSNGGGTFPTWDSSKDPTGGSLQISSIISRAYVLNCSNPTAGTSTKSVFVSVTGLPNLLLPVWANGQRINTSVGSTTSILVANQPNTLRVQVKNAGSSTTAIGFTNKFSASWGWNFPVIIGNTVSGALNVGEINNPYDEIPWTPLQSGHVEIGFCADTFNVITEQIETSGDNCAYRQVSVSPAPGTPTVTFTVPGGVVNSTSSMSTTTKLGATTTISWTATGATSCLATSGGGTGGGADPYWTGSVDPNGGSAQINPIITSTSILGGGTNIYKNYTLSCTGPGGETIIKAIRVNVTSVQPTVTLSAAQTSILRGSATTLTWSVTDANTCVATSTPHDPNWTGSVSRSGGSLSTSNLSASTNYKITCQSPSGSTIKNIQVDVVDPPPTISLTANSNPITPEDTTELRWTTSGASSCVGTSNPPEPLWDGARSTTSGAITVGPDVTTEYILTCTNAEGTSIPAPLTVSVAEVPPIIDFSLNDSIITENKESAILTWNIRGANSCTGVSVPSDPEWDSFNFNADYSSSKTVSPSTTTIYSIDCSGRWGTTTGSVATLTVIPEATITKFKVCIAGTEGTPGERCAISGGTLEGEDVDPGTPLEVFWDSEDATECQGISGHTFSTENDPTDGEDLSVRATSYADSIDTYTLACGSLNYLTSDYVSIYVHTNNVIPSIWIEPKVVKSSGGGITVRWDTNNGDQSVCSIKGGGLTNALLQAGTETGSSPVQVLGRTTFVISCPALNGTDTESATTTVELSPRIWGR